MTAARAPLRITMLGPFEVRRGDMPVEPGEWRTQKNVSVLEVLLDARPRVVPVDRIIDLVWPEADPAAARNSVQVAIRTIRTVLEPELRSGRASRSVRTDSGGYRWSAEGGDAAIDVDTFASSRDRALAAERRGEIDAAIDGFITAARGYRGDYLSDDPYAEWALATRERLHEQYVDAVERLARLLVRRRRIDEAIEWSERALALDPAREGLYAALMRAHLAAGRRAHALVVYERAQRVLRAELGAEPDTELRTLRDAKAPGAAFGAAPARAPAAAVPFVGRSRELDELAAAWSATTRPGQVVAIHGPPGMGKTRLLREFSGSLGTPGRALALSATETGVGTSLGPFAEALAVWRDTATLMQRHRLDAQLAVMSSSGDRGARFEAVAEALRMALGSGRGLLAFDDLHWSDDDSIGALAYVVRRLGAGCLTAVTIRSGEVLSDTLRAFLDEARGDGRLRELVLRPLAADDVAVLASVVSPEHSSPALVERVLSMAQGHPLFVLELLREAEVSGADPAALPRTLGASIEARLRRLSDEERDAMAAAAIIGAPFRAELAARTLATSLDRTLDVLDALLARGLLEPAEEGRAYAIGHPLLQQAVYDGISPGRRVAGHLRVAAALAELHADDAAAVAADRLRHLVAAGAPWPEIAAAAVLSADHALERHRYADALRPLESAASALGARLPDPAVLIALGPIRERLADALAGLRRVDDALAIHAEILAGAGRDPIVRGRIRRKSARLLGLIRGRLVEARATINDAETELGDRDDTEARVERAHLAAAGAHVDLEAGDHASALSSARRAQVLVSEIGSAEALITDAIETEALALSRLGRLDEAELAVRRGIARARDRGDRLAEASLLTSSLADVQARRDQTREALESVERAIELRRESGAQTDTVNDLLNHGIMLVPSGELVRSRAVLEEALERSKALGDTVLETWVRSVLGRTLLYLGDLAAAREELEQAIELADRTGNAERGSFARIRLGEVALSEGDARETRTLADEALALGERTGGTFALSSANELLARAALLDGDPRTALERALRALEIAITGGYRRLEMFKRITVAEAAWALGDRATAREHIELAVAHYRSGGEAYGRVRALQVLATTVLASRPRERERVLRQALAEAKRIGAKLLARSAEDAITSSRASAARP